MLLESEVFLLELTKLFQKAKSSGSVTLTMKRFDGHNKPRPRNGALPEPNEYKCLIRATLGNRKLSTVINHKDVTKFQMAYGNLLKANIDGLKKKDKKSARGKNKSKSTQ
ncbi:signal recognition particle 14 kDa protein-like [Babylonia areolata]|uniref:signal recognition particle 14 kDa protein-like n=1 Tax=Babylonia areolata TaxID=304850 RepID=UPI003FD30DE9